MPVRRWGVFGKQLLLNPSRLLFGNGGIELSGISIFPKKTELRLLCVISQVLDFGTLIYTFETGPPPPPHHTHTHRKIKSQFRSSVGHQLPSSVADEQP